MGLDYKNIWKIDPSLNTQSNFIDDFNALLDFLRNAPGNFGTPPLIDFFPLPEAPIPEFQDNYVELNDQYILYNWSPSNNTYNDEKIEFTTLGFNEIADNKIISLTSISGTTLFDNINLLNKLNDSSSNINTGDGIILQEIIVLVYIKL